MANAKYTVTTNIVSLDIIFKNVILIPLKAYLKRNIHFPKSNFKHPKNSHQQKETKHISAVQTPTATRSGHTSKKSTKIR